MFSISSMIKSVVILIVAGLIFGLLFWLVDYCELRQPFNKVAKVVLAIAAVLVCIGVLLSLAGIQIFSS